MRTLFLLTVLALSAPAFAQTVPTAKPKAATPASANDEQPALDTNKATKQLEAGTTIFGNDESPIGLFITPWRDSRPEKDIDRPARLLQEDMRPIDKDVFERQVEYYDALSGAAKRKKSGP